MINVQRKQLPLQKVKQQCFVQYCGMCKSNDKFPSLCQRIFGQNCGEISDVKTIICRFSRDISQSKKKITEKSTKIRLEFSLRFVTSEISRQRNETTVRPFEKKVSTRVKGRLRSSRQSLEIFNKVTKMFGNVRMTSDNIHKIFGKSSETSLFGYVYKINKLLHGCLEI